jgi:hypothetical protein
VTSTTVEKKECKCEYCIKCSCGHRADEHMAGVGQCFLCDCPEHSDKSWKDKIDQPLHKGN